MGLGMFFNNLQEGTGGVAESSLAAEDQTQFALQLQLRDGDRDQSAAGQLGFHREPGNERDAVAQLHEAFDGLQRRQFDFHLERRAAALKGGEHFFTQGRGHIVGNEDFAAETGDGGSLFARQGMARSDDADQLVTINNRRTYLRIIGAETDHTDLNGVREDLIGDAAGEGTLHGDLDVGVVAAEGIQHRKEIEAGVLIGGEGEAALLHGAQLGQRLPGFRAQVEHLHRVVVQNFAGVSEGAGAGAALEEGFAQFSFQPGDDLADRRLGAMQAGGGAGEAALFGYGEKGFKLKEIQFRAP